MLTAKELMTALKISDSTLYRLRKEGLPFVKLSYRNVRYDLNEVVTWLKENKR